MLPILQHIHNITNAGIPRLRFIRQRLAKRVHFWPFGGGWDIPDGRSATAEVYPAMWSRSSPARTAKAISMMPTALPLGSRLRPADLDGRLC